MDQEKAYEGKDSSLRIWTLSNVLSMLRLLASFVLFLPSSFLRLLVVLFAIVTDVFDGYFARRWLQETVFGKIIDPLADKVFVYIALWVFYFEGHFLPEEMVAFCSRDISLIAFFLLLFVMGERKKIRLGSIYCGKVVTSLQLVTLGAMSLDLYIPSAIFIMMAAFGLLSFWELWWGYKKSVQQ
jgi:CDP-diacylglycerol---glycerol-3-phosphate 3-phosphatidyltransferase